ncbi:MAG: hypothetical protein COU07_02200 [Candidatus Harrisonbacteria bacterium CG10_big_fil_rev_8_21_14_0_10_40_38]|uniref:Thioredoxin domain-containing protein n=1 Tax=Candidatus Harrisonbacteria bacterium CG10_big_fil_rev_8_21_14_0_10_40_38 TaxID=1974583 RepID=A0A2H0US87_9BACT|nr:MAG: hypothetical protein COU07_02200 [Candidatus Harrisonbacteria bacterium CG10_big_fil_rev_8_21_14_0_10_40_38]
MNSKRYLLGAVILVVVVVAIYGISNTKKPEGSNEPNKEDTVMDEMNDLKNLDEMMDGENMMDDTMHDAMEYKGSILSGKNSPLLDFTSSDYEAAEKTDKLIVLYFYANWCPICKAEFPLMQEAFNELKGNDVIGFRVNYNDSDTDKYEENLAREFGVAYQHTKVFLKNGERILKAPDGWDKNRYITEINKAL